MLESSESSGGERGVPAAPRSNPKYQIDQHLDLLIQRTVAAALAATLLANPPEHNSVEVTGGAIGAPYNHVIEKIGTISRALGALGLIAPAQNQIPGASNFVALPRFAFEISEWAAMVSLSRAAIYQILARPSLPHGLVARRIPEMRRSVITIFDGLDWLLRLPRVHFDQDQSTEQEGKR
jgi:hypothetical protein